MARRILIFLAAAVVSLALCLFLALALKWPSILVYAVGLTPMFVAATWIRPADRNREESQD